MRRTSTSIAYKLEFFESGLFLLFVSFIMPLSAILAGGVIYNRDVAGGNVAGAVGGLFLLMWFLLDAPMLWRVWRTMLLRRFPVALCAAIYEPRYSWVTRPVIALWWIGHFVAGAAAIVATEIWASHSHVELTTGALVVQYALVFVYSLATNGYLMQAMAAIDVSPDWLRRLWKWRISVDLALIAAAMLGGRFVAAYRW